MRLIDVDELSNKLIEQFSRKRDMQSEVILNTMLWKLDQAPAAEGERVVRCKDCKHRDPEDKKCDCGHAIQWQLPRDDDWFCADGERKDDE